MEIQSAFNAGVQGFQRANNDVKEAAVDIATHAEGSKGQDDLQQASASLAVPLREPSGLTESVLNLKVAEVQAKASVNVIQAADENLGTLIDVRV